MDPKTPTPALQLVSPKEATSCSTSSWQRGHPTQGLRYSHGSHPQPDTSTGDPFLSSNLLFVMTYGLTGLRFFPTTTKRKRKTIDKAPVDNIVRSALHAMGDQSMPRRLTTLGAKVMDHRCCCVRMILKINRARLSW